MPRLGYNSCGFARSDDIFDIAERIAGIGYAGLELSLQEGHFHPYCHGQRERRALRRHLRQLGLALVINTGARYVLGPVKHEPGLVSRTREARERFLTFMEDCIRMAPQLGAGVVMLHSGYSPAGVETTRAWQWAVQGIQRLARCASAEDVQLGFEFHPDMFVRDLACYWRLKREVGEPAVRLTLDVGHVACTEDDSPTAVIASCAPQIVNVHLEDIKGRVHRHLPIGQGDIDFGAVFRALDAVGYPGLVNAELNSADLDCDEDGLARSTWEHLVPLLD